MKNSKNTKATEKPITQSEVLENRRKLREYCQQKGLIVPEFFASTQFAPISLWAMKKNTFPLCIKTAQNLKNNQHIHILKAFRELPEFFETIQAKNNNCEVLIEEFLDGKAHLEVTYLSNKLRLITQVSFAHSMKLLTKWRCFPINLPDGILAKIKKIVENFKEITEKSLEPVRFSFVIKNAMPILTSINSDNDRLEYEDAWRKAAKLQPLVTADYQQKSDFVSKINIYRGIKTSEIDFSPIESVCQHSSVKMETRNSRLYVMLTSSAPQKLAEDSSKVDAIAKQIIANSKETD